MHVVTVLPPKYEAILGTRGRATRHWLNEAGMKQMDSSIGRPQKAHRYGPTRRYHRRLHHRQWRGGDQLPDSSITPFKGQKGERSKGGYRAPMVIRWPTTSSLAPSSTSCLQRSTGCRRLSISPADPEAVDFEQIEAAASMQHHRSTLDGFDERDFLEEQGTELRRRTSSSTTLDRRRLRDYATRTGRCLHHVAAWASRLDPPAHPISTSLRCRIVT